MPSGPPELHDYWCAKDETGAGDLAAKHYLEDRGYILTRRWTWIQPESIETPSPEDNKAINYLVWEWDWGGLDGEE
jgi:hypothetical protein